MGRLVKDFFNTLESQQLAIFCGAGISKNSGLPLASEFTQHVLKQLPIGAEKNDVRKINDSLPFEAFIEVIENSPSQLNISQLYSQGQPNANHFLIAKLAKLRYVQTVVTTNFDLLIERAFEQEGLREKEDFEVFWREDQFLRLNFEMLDEDFGDKIVILKIHGSAHDETSLRTTLTAVASRVLSQARMNIIKHLFSSGEHDKVLILGYSCSDAFDITPQIQSLEKDPLKEITFIDHVSRHADNRITRTVANISKNPFVMFPCIRIRVNTDIFVRSLWDAHAGQWGDYHSTIAAFDWKKHIDSSKDWDADSAIGNYVSGVLCYKISSFDNAETFLQAALEKSTADTKTQDELELHCHSALTSTFRARGKYEKAITYAKNALALDKVKHDTRLQAGFYAARGDAYSGLGEFEHASECYAAALDKLDPDDFSDRRTISSCLGGLGNAATLQNKPEEALDYHKTAFEMALDYGDKNWELRCRVNFGNICFVKKRWGRARKEYEKALDIAKSIGDVAGEAGCCVDLGLVYAEMGLGYSGYLSRSMEWLNKAKGIAELTGDLTVMPKCYAGFGKVYSRRDKPKRAIKCYDTALVLNRSIGDNVLFFDCYRDLSLVFLYCRCQDQAIRCAKNAKKYANKIGRADFEAQMDKLISMIRIDVPRAGRPL
jgi:tetratricopeptide (TPR) repeat protein